MKKLFFIQYASQNSLIDSRIQQLGAYHQVFNGWIVESFFDAKTIYEKVSVDYPLMQFLVVEVNKSNYYGRYYKELWELFK